MIKETSIGRPNIDEQSFDAVIRQLLERRDQIITYGGWNGGYFSPLEKGYCHPASTELNDAEDFVAKVGRAVLEDVGVWNSVDLGSMAGFSDVLIASQVFHEEIESSKVKMLATNYEHDFQIQRLLVQARKNLDLYGSNERWQEYMGMAKKGVQTGLLLTNKPILESQWHIDFVEQNHKYVEYVSGLSTEYVGSVRALLPNRGKIMFLHERMGGFNNCDNLSVAMEQVMNNMDPDFGVIMTTHNLGSLIKPFESVDIGIADYHVYAARESAEIIRKSI